MKYIFYYQTEIGKIGIVQENDQITNVLFENESEAAAIPELQNYESSLLKEAGKQLLEYMGGQRHTFELPLSPCGTGFMKNVWNCLCKIPYGETRSYKDIAKSIGNQSASRAVGQANNKNPIPIFIPCHRVIGANGKLTGYRGGLEVKQRLLELEKIHWVK